MVLPDLRLRGVRLDQVRAPLEVSRDAGGAVRGDQPEDIVEYDLPADPLADSDINALESGLEDPRFQTDYWEEQIELQLDIGRRSPNSSRSRESRARLRYRHLPPRAARRDGRDLSPPGDTSLLVRFVEFADLAALTVRVVVHVLINDPVLLVGGRVCASRHRAASSPRGHTDRRRSCRRHPCRTRRVWPVRSPRV